jgi:DNA-binding transcriptional regulator YbjK
MEDITICSSAKPVKYSKVINLTMYGCKVHFIISNQMNKLVASLYKKHNVPMIEDLAAEGVLLCFEGTNYYIIIDADDLSHNTIAHEVYHATVKVTEDREINDEETQAWLCGHLAQNVYEFVDKKKLTIKHGG